MIRELLQQTLWRWWGDPAHPAEWDGRRNGGGRGSQRFWEYLWTLEQLDFTGPILDVGAGDTLFLPDLLTRAGVEVWAVDPQIPAARQQTRCRAETLEAFVADNPGLLNRFGGVACVSVLEHVADKATFCRALDALNAPLVLTCERAYEAADLVTLPQLYTCLAVFQQHYLRRMETCPVWADNAAGGLWRPLGLVLAPITAHDSSGAAGPPWLTEGAAPAFGRRDTILATLRQLYHIHPGPACLVETGTLREDNPHGMAGDGWSTVAWGWYAQQTGGHAWTVDNAPDSLAVCRRRTAPYAASLDYVLADSVAFLRAWRETRQAPIDLLYLDSLDYVDVAQSAAHCLAEAQAALPALAPTGLVLIDDTHPTAGTVAEAPAFWGKGAQAVPFLLTQGFRPLWATGGQVLLARAREARSPAWQRAAKAPGVTPTAESTLQSTLPTQAEEHMGQETRKAQARRRREGYFETIFVGEGLDIGSGDDPVLPDCAPWDLAQGDAQTLAGIPPARFDWIYSSHCLEHLVDPSQALARWWEVLRPGGKLLVVVPDEDLYEQGQWPSAFNPGHRWTFTIHKSASWSPVSLNMTDLVAPLPGHRVLWLRTCDAGYDYTGGVWDRTHGAAEAHIELLVQKVAG